MSTVQDALSLAQLCLHDPSHVGIQHAQTLHRLAIVDRWNIPAGSRVLELGCGQGDCTAVLASVTGELGTVIALDSADLDYGSPYTLGQAQHHLSQSALGGRITWVKQHPLDYLASRPLVDSAYFNSDATVLAHCLWYFSSPSLIFSTFRVLKQHSKRLLLAEWALKAASSSAVPHVLAVLAQAALECRKAESDSNVRTVLGPKRLKELALAAGWQLESESHMACGDGMLDGQWEVSACLSASFERQVEEQVANEREREVVLALHDACETSLEGVQGGLEGVSAMDVWVANFV